MKKTIIIRIAFVILSAVVFICGVMASTKNEGADSDVSSAAESQPLVVDDFEVSSAAELQPLIVDDFDYEKEDIVVDSQPIVVDALNYEKTVITADYALSGFEQGAFGTHTIRIPKINLDTPTAQRINREMYEIGNEKYEILINNQEYNQIYNYDYLYKEEGGVIGIIVTKMNGPQCGGVIIDYEAFYYDRRTDKQLSFKEYLSVLGVNINDISNNYKIKEAYRNVHIGEDGSVVVLDAVLDSKSSTVRVKTPEANQDSGIIETDTSFVTNFRNIFELYKGNEDEVVMTVGSKTAYVSGAEVKIDAEPVISSGKTMLPARFVAEKLGATVDWDASSRKVTIKKDSLIIELVVDSSTAYVNGREQALESPAFIRNGRIYTPLRFVAEKLGAGVEWLRITKQVVIKSDVFEQFCNNVDLVEEIRENLKLLNDSYWYREFIIENSFLVDLDDDFIPELCVATASPDFDFDMYVFKYENGDISMSPNILYCGGAGSAGWSDRIAIMDDGTARIVSTYIGSIIKERYIGFWGGEPTQCEFDAYETNLIEDRECSFTEIWEYQKSKYLS